MEDFAPWTVSDRHDRSNRQEFFSPTATDHRQEQRVEDRMYQRERDSFEYQCQCDRFND